MREGWEIKTIGDVCDILDRKRKPISKRDREPGPYPYYGASCIQDYVSGYLFDGRYLLIGEDGAKWGPGEDTAYIAEGKFWVNNHAHIVKAKEGYLDDFLRYYIKHLDLNPIVAGAIIPKLTQEKLATLEVPIPSLPEQQRIVDILDREFAKIDALKANAEKSLYAAKDLFQATLKKELEPKEGWMTQTIGDVCFVQGGSTPRRTEKAFWENGTYPWFTIDDVREQGRIISDTKQKITKLAWDKIRVFPANSVLLCCTASVGEYALSTIPISSNQQFNGLTIKDEKTLLPMFLFHFASTLKDKLLSLSGKATIDFVSGGKVRSVPISFPASIKEQETIISRLDNINNKCTTLQENYQKILTLCDDLKQSLLRKAFSGEL